MSGDYAAQVWAWADTLRSGATQTWQEFRAGAPAPGPSAGMRTPLPTAAQLEVVRRLAGTVEVPDFAGLADLVLATGGAGRGRLDVPLPWDEPPAFGSPPVQPEDLSPDELLRIVAGALATLLVRRAPEKPAAQRRSWRPFRRQFVLLGAPSSQRVITEALTSRGLRQGGPKPTYVVLAGPLETMMAQRWAARVRAGSTIRWRRFWRYSHNHDRIPPAIQAPLIAERLAHERGGGRVHVVLARDSVAAMETVAGIFGVDAPEVEEPAELTGTDLLRAVNAPLTLAAGRDDRARIVRDLWPGLVHGEGSRRIGVPKEHLDWAIAAAERQRERIVNGARTAGYAVHGEPGIVVPDPQAALHRAIRRADTLQLGLEALGRAWSQDRAAAEGEVR